MTTHIYWNTATGKKTKRSVSGPVTVTTKNIVLSEDRRFQVNVKTVAIGTSVPIDYTFSNSNLGTKRLYIKFIASNNKEQNVRPFPVSIRLVAPTYPLTLRGGIHPRYTLYIMWE